MFPFLRCFTICLTLFIAQAQAQSLPQVASVAVSGGPLGVSVSGTKAYLANYGTNTLQVYDVRPPASPTSINITPMPGMRARSVVAVGNMAYVLCYPAGAFNTSQVVAYDVSNPAAPLQRGTVSFTAPAVAVPPVMAASSALVCVAGNPNGTVQVFDSRLNLLCYFTEGVEHIAINGNVIYIRNGANTAIYEILTNNIPVLRSRIAGRIDQVSGTRAYGLLAGTATTGGMLYVYDISAPLTPLLQGSVATNGGAQLAVSGTTVFTNGPNSFGILPSFALQAYDVSVPTVPVLRATAGGVPSASTGDLSANASNSAYIVNGSTLQVYSFSATPTAARPAAQPALGLYPNPAHAVLQLPHTRPGATVTIHDLAGRVHLTTALTPNSQVDIRSLPAGLYLVRAGSLVQKLTVE